MVYYIVFEKKLILIYRVYINDLFKRNYIFKLSFNLISEVNKLCLFFIIG